MKRRYFGDAKGRVVLAHRGAGVVLGGADLAGSLWVDSHVAAGAFFGGVGVWVPRPHVQRPTILGGPIKWKAELAEHTRQKNVGGCPL